MTRHSAYELTVGDALITVILPTREVNPEHLRASNMWHLDRWMTPSELGFALETGGFDPNEPFEEGAMPPLHIAGGLGRTDSLGLLIRAGADVNSKAGAGGATLVPLGKSPRRKAAMMGGSTPLWEAAKVGSVEGCRMLLEAGAGVRVNGSAFQLALEGGHTRAMRTLLEAGVDPNLCWQVYCDDRELGPGDWALRVGGFPNARVLAHFGGNLSATLWIRDFWSGYLG
jgi:ankyrin repeat protein